MLIPSGRFSLPFTCVDATGLPTAPTGTPVGTLVKNGTDLGDTVTVTMSTANGIAICTIPSDAVADDRFHIRVSAVVSAVTYTVSGPSDSVQNPVTLPTIPTNWITADGIATDAVSEIATSVLTTQMTESYAADGTAPTLTQAIMLALQNVGEVSISGVTKTVKKLDGTTTAATYTLDSATDPTSSTRAT